MYNMHEVCMFSGVHRVAAAGARRRGEQMRICDAYERSRREVGPGAARPVVGRPASQMAAVRKRS